MWHKCEKYTEMKDPGNKKLWLAYCRIIDENGSLFYYRCPHCGLEKVLDKEQLSVSSTPARTKSPEVPIKEHWIRKLFK